MEVLSLILTLKIFVASRNIEWRTNIEAAPWQGGFFERMVRSVKTLLKENII